MSFNLERMDDQTRDDDAAALFKAASGTYLLGSKCTTTIVIYLFNVSKMFCFLMVPQSLLVWILSFESLFEKNGTEVCNAYVRDRPREKEDRACVQ